MSTSIDRPTREAVFTETMHIGIVVRDLDAAVRRYVEAYGIGPWERHELTTENATDLRVYGQPATLWRIAVATAKVGHVMWELIEPLDDESIFARFLAEKGAGVHHIAVATPRFVDAVAEQAARGNTLVLSGTYSGIDIAFLPTDRDLGVILEISSDMPGADHEPDVT